MLENPTLILSYGHCKIVKTPFYHYLTNTQYMLKSKKILNTCAFLTTQICRPISQIIAEAKQNKIWFIVHILRLPLRIKKTFLDSSSVKPKENILRCKALFKATIKFLIKTEYTETYRKLHISDKLNLQNYYSQKGLPLLILHVVQVLL